MAKSRVEGVGRVRPRRARRGAPARGRSLATVARVALAIDVVVMVAVEVVAAFLRLSYGWFGVGVDDSTVKIAGPVILVSWIAAIAAFGGYRAQIFGAGVDEYRALLVATLSTAGVTGVLSFLTRFQLSRGFFLLVFSLGSVALVLERLLLRRAIHRARVRGNLCRNIVIAGSLQHVDEIGRVLGREKWLGYRLLGALLPARPGEAAIEETEQGIPVLGSIDRAPQVLSDVGAEVIFVAGGAVDGAAQMRELVWDLEAKDIEVVVAPHLTDVARERVKIRPVAGLPLVHVGAPRHLLAGRRAKRIFDVMLTSFILLVTAPLLAAIALAIKLGDRGPVFFRQIRIGQHGEEFRVLKFRTMVVDAEARLAAVQESQGFTSGRWKMQGDPRVTPVGRLLRRSSLDELPQLFNVLSGRMSLVGPRPMPADEVALYDQTTRRRLHVRPGITGLWQVSGRSDLSWSDSMRLDLYYVDNWSMVQDLAILVRTFGAVATSRGAY